MSDKTEDDNFLKSLDLEDLGLDDIDFGPEKTKGPIAEFGGGLKEEIFNRSTGLNFFRRVLRLAMPEGYVKAYDAAKSVTNDARSIASEVQRKSASDIVVLADHLEQSLPSIKDKTPEKLYKKLEASIKSYRENREFDAKNSARTGLNGERETQENEVETYMTNALTGAQAETAKFLDKGSERRFQQDRLERRVRDKVTAVQSKTLINEIRASNSYLRTMNAFNDQYKAKWMRSSLELQYRSFQALRDIRTLSERSYKAQIEGFKKIIHNSALPDFIKQNIPGYRKARGTLNDTIGDFHSGYGFKLRDNLTAGLTGGAQNTLSGLAQMLSMGIGDMGMSRGNMLGRLAGGVVSSGANMFIAPMISQMLAPYLRTASNKTGGQDHLLSYLMRSIPGLLQERANDWGSTGLNGMLHKLALRFAPRFGRNPFFDKHGFRNGDQPATFNQITQRSIVEVIPGLLSHILKEVSSLRTGKDQPLLEYSYAKSRFVTQAKAQQDTVKAIIPTSAKDSLKWSMLGAIDSVDGEKELSSEARNALAKQFLRDASTNRHFDPARYANEEGYSNVDPKIRQELAAHFKRRYAVNADGSLAHNLQNNRRRDRDSEAFSSLHYAVPDSENEIRRQVDSGQMENLMRLGVVEHDNGREVINYERLYELSLDDEAGNEGGDHGPEGGGGEPWDPDGRLNIPLYKRGSRTPCITPMKLNGGEYINKSTGLPIRSVYELESTVVDDKGRVVVSALDLRRGLRDRQGKIVYRYNGLGGARTETMRRNLGRKVRRTSAKARRAASTAAAPHIDELRDHLHSAYDHYNEGKDALVSRASDARNRLTDVVSQIRGNLKQAVLNMSEHEVAQRVYGNTEAARKRILAYMDDPSLLDEDRKRIAHQLEPLNDRIHKELGRLDPLKERVSQSTSKLDELKSAALGKINRLEPVRDRAITGMRQRWTNARRQLGNMTPESVAKAVFGENAVNRVNEYRANPELMLEDYKQLQSDVTSTVKTKVEDSDLADTVRKKAVKAKEDAWTKVETQLAAIGSSVDPHEIAQRVHGSGVKALRAIEAYRKDPELMLEDAKTLARKVEAKTAGAKQSLQETARSLHHSKAKEEKENFRPDIYIAGRKEPVIKSIDFTAGVLYDIDTGNVIRSVNDIKGAVVDDEGRYILSPSDIEAGLFDHKGNKLEALQRSMEQAGKAGGFTPGPVKEITNRYKAIKGNVGKVTRAANKLFGKLPPCDVYVSGESEPSLRASVMKDGGYLDVKTGRVLESPEDIRGDIIDVNNNIVLSKRDIAHLEDARGRRIKIPNIAIRAIKAITRGYWNFTKAYYRKLFRGIKAAPKWLKDHPKTALALGGLMFGGPSGAATAAGLGALFGLGRKKEEGADDKPGLLRRVGGKYVKASGKYMEKLGGIPAWLKDHPKMALGLLGGATGNPLLALGGLGLGGLLNKKRRSKIARTAAFLNKPGKIKLDREEQENPILFTLASINNHLALMTKSSKIPSLKKILGLGDDDDDSKKDGDTDIDIDLGDDDRRGRRRRGRRGHRGRGGRSGGRKGIWKRAAKGLGKAAERIGISAGKRAAVSTVARGAAGLAGRSALAGGAELLGGGSLLEAGAAIAGEGLLAGAGEVAVGAAGLVSLPAVAIAGGVALGGYLGMQAFHGIAEYYRDHLWRFRMAQYGVFGNDDMCSTVQTLEQYLLKVFPTGAVNYDALIKSGRFNEIFQILPDQKARQQTGVAWLNNRFAPIFKQTMAALQGTNPAVNLYDMNSKFTDEEKAYFLKLAYIPFTGETPYRYTFSPFNDPLPAGQKEIEEQYAGALAQLDGDAKRRADYRSTPPIKDKANGKAEDKKDIKEQGKDANAIKRGEVQREDPTRVKVPLKTPFGIHAPEQLTPLQQMRFYGYGLVNQTKDEVENILAFEREVISKIRISGESLTVPVQKWMMVDTARKLWGKYVDTDESGEHNWYHFSTWFNGRFLPVITEWAKGMYFSNPQIDLMKADAGIPYSVQLKVATYIYAAKSYETGPIWSVTSTPFGSNAGNGKAEAEGILTTLKAQADKTPMATELPPATTANKSTVTTADQKALFNRAVTALGKAKDQFDINNWNPLKGLTGGLKSGGLSSWWNSTRNGGETPAPVPVNATLFNGSGNTYSMQDGLGGLIDDIPMPKVDGNREAAIPMLQKVALMTGVDINVLAAIIGSESGFQSGASAGKADPSQTAAGLGQFTADTWYTVLNKHADKYGLEKLRSTADAKRDPRRFDPRINALLSAELIKDNAAAFQGFTGRKPTPEEIYMVHFLGPTGANKFFQADQNEYGYKVFPKEATKNTTIFYRNGKTNQPRTLNEIFRLMTSKVSKGLQKGPIPTLSKGLAEQASDDRTVLQQVGTTFSDRLDDASTPATAGPKVPTVNRVVASTTAPAPTSASVSSVQPSQSTFADNMTDDAPTAPTSRVPAPRVEVKSPEPREPQQLYQAKRRDEQSEQANGFYSESLKLQADMAGSLKSILSTLMEQSKETAEKQRVTQKTGTQSPLISNRINR